MNAIIDWFARNTVAANLLMLVIVIAGALSLPQTRKETIPTVSLDMITINVFYPGASAEEVERGVCVRLEEAVHDLEGIKKMTSSATEGVCMVLLEMTINYDISRLLDDVKSRVDNLTTLPKEAETPSIREIAIKNRALSVAVSGATDEASLKRLGQRIRDQLADLPSVTQVELSGVRDYEISIEVSEAALQQYGLSLDEIANAIRQRSLSLPAGSLKTTSGERLLRIKGQLYNGEQFGQLVIRSHADGSRLLLGDVAEVRDGFEEDAKRSFFNGQNSVLLQVYRVGNQSILQISKEVHDFVEQTTLPEGMTLTIWRDSSEYFKGRMNLLLRNAVTGLTLVFFILVLFLRFRLAFWVSLGIPISFMGAFMFLPGLDASINMISMFAFILVLGIVVDDAIVVGEHIHIRQKELGDNLQGAIQGAQEVAKPVIFAVLTSVVAFMPMLTLPGANGKLWGIIPTIVILTLLFSLLESLIILPAHLGKMKMQQPPPKQGGGIGAMLARLQRRFSQGLEGLIRRFYQPLLEAALKWRYLTVAIFISGLMLIGSVVAGGYLKLVFFPAIEGNYAIASLTLPQGSTLEQTETALNRIEKAALTLQTELRDPNGNQTIVHILTSLGEQPMTERSARMDQRGTHLGEVALELSPSENRKLSTEEIGKRWRTLAGKIADASKLNFSASMRHSGKAVDVELSGPDLTILKQLSQQVRLKLTHYPGVEEIEDSFKTGKQEIQLQLRPGAEQLGLTLQDLARQVRQGFYGEEVQRIQRGRDEVRVMLRYPLEQRRSISDLEAMQIRLKDGRELPFVVVASAQLRQGPQEIQRRDRRRIVNVTADVDSETGDSSAILKELKESVLPELLQNHPEVRFSLEGQAREQRETMATLGRGFLLALLAIYALMAIPFRSYAQPLIIMSAIPFGLVGAVVGHLLLGKALSVLSLTGMVAVAGVVVNDNLVLVDHINRARERGEELFAAVRNAGVARFRPIILTSLTTFAGLTPLMLERSVQAQFLIPMAISLAFGVLFATVISLLLVPASYYLIEDFKRLFAAKNLNDSAK
ncbi:MAG: efflux RND transporter permease subunit [Gammaproteobacteria bacterium]|nr:efflux RND transporter permease subunit [Gammaproteobacteria bacterium]